MSVPVKGYDMRVTAMGSNSLTSTEVHLVCTDVMKLVYDTVVYSALEGCKGACASFEGSEFKAVVLKVVVVYVGVTVFGMASGNGKTDTVVACTDMCSSYG